MRTFTITESQLEDVIEEIVADVDYDLHKDMFKYEDDDGALKARLKELAINAIENGIKR